MKRCPVCEESYNDSWKKCLKDDSPLDNLGRVSEKVKNVRESDRTERYKSVGGWLGLFVWSLLLAGPIHFVLIVYQITTGSGYFIYPADLPYILNVVYAALAFLEIVAAIFLIRPKISSALFARGVLLAWSIFRAYSIYLVWDRGMNEIVSASMGFLTDFVWLLYFFFSKRVKVRYYPEPVSKNSSDKKYLYDFMRKL